MVRRIILLSLLAAAAIPASAQALAPCPAGNGTNHCYELANLYRSNVPAVVIAVQLKGSGISGVTNFASAETWAVFNSSSEPLVSGDWIEIGLIVSPAYYNGSTTPHTFWASKTAGGGLYVHLEPNPPPSGQFPPTTYYTITSEGNGCYSLKTLLSSEVGGYYWKLSLARYCGRRGSMERVVTGGETAPQAETHVWGKVNSAWSMGENGRYTGEWQLYEPMQYGYGSPEMALESDSSNPAPGDFIWHTATLPAASAQAARVHAAAAKPGYTVSEGKALATRLKLAAPGIAKPTGKYRATYRNSAGQIEDEYVGNAYPDEATVRKAGAQ